MSETWKIIHYAIPMGQFFCGSEDAGFKVSSLSEVNCKDCLKAVESWCETEKDERLTEDGRWALTLDTGFAACRKCGLEADYLRHANFCGGCGAMLKEVAKVRCVGSEVMNETERQQEVIRDAVLLAVSRLQQCDADVSAIGADLAAAQCSRDRAYETLTKCAAEERAWVKKTNAEKQQDEAATYEPKE